MAILTKRWISASPWILLSQDDAGSDGSDLPLPAQGQKPRTTASPEIATAPLTGPQAVDNTDTTPTSRIWLETGADNSNRTALAPTPSVVQRPIEGDQGNSHDALHHACSELLPEATLGLDSTDPLWSTKPLLDPSLTFRLHSDPTATRIIYLDFDGHTTTKTAWNSTAFGMTSSFTSPAFDIDGNPAIFSSTELTRIQQIWQRVASDFAPFDVDVTTQAPPLDWLSRTSSTDTTYGIRVVVTSYGPYSSSAGGVSFVGSFTASSDTPAFVYNRTVIGASEAISHEVGHTLGLSHDGNGTTAYYAGQGTGETSWAPIMGCSYTRSVTTWDIGQYTGTNNGSSIANYGKGPDDLAVITGYNGFGYQPDLVGNSPSTATSLKVSGGQVSQFGTIETRQDLDYYSFDLLTTGSIDLSFDPYWIRTYVDGDDVWGGTSTAWASRVSDLYSSTSYVENGSNLDLLVNLFNSSGKLLASSNPSGLAASLTMTGLAAGRYFISLDGTAYGDPMAATPTGYTDADSLGFYRISGTINGASDSLTAMALSDTSVATDSTDPITGIGNHHIASSHDDSLINRQPTPQSAADNPHAVSSAGTPVTSPLLPSDLPVSGLVVLGSSMPPPPLPGKLTPLHPDHFFYQGA